MGKIVRGFNFFSFFSSFCLLAYFVRSFVCSFYHLFFFPFCFVIEREFLTRTLFIHLFKWKRTGMTLIKMHNIYCMFILAIVFLIVRIITQAHTHRHTHVSCVLWWTHQLYQHIYSIDDGSFARVFETCIKEVYHITVFFSWRLYSAYWNWTQKKEEAATKMNVNEQSTTMVANIIGSRSNSSNSKITRKTISDKLKKETITTTTLYFIKRLACNGKHTIYKHLHNTGIALMCFDILPNGWRV